MAKNWKVGEAVRAIQVGNKEDVLDIGRRFPLFLRLASQTNEAGAQLLDTIPDYVTARKVESVLKGDIVEGEDDAATTGEDKAPEADKKADKKDAYSGKTAKELYTLCKERKIEVEPKKDAAEYLKLLKKDDAAKAKAAAKEKEKKDDDWGDEKKEDKKEKDDWDI